MGLLGTGTFVAFGQNPNACTIQPSCTPSQGVCSSPAQNSQLPDAEVGVFYSTVIQFSVANDFSGIPIGACTMELGSAPAGLTVVFTPEGTSETNCIISGGQNACVTIYGTPLNTDLNAQVVLNGSTEIGGVPQNLSFEYNLDILSSSTSSLSENMESQKLIIAPNPSNAVFKVTTQEPTVITVYDLAGNRMGTYDVDASIDLNTESWSEGIYFVLDSRTGKSYRITKY